MRLDPPLRIRRAVATRLLFPVMLLFVCAAPLSVRTLAAQEGPDMPPPLPPRQSTPPQSAAPAPPPDTPALFEDPMRAQNAPSDVRPLAIVSLDKKVAGAAAEVTGALQVNNGRAIITDRGSITSGNETTQVALPYRGTLRICASTTVKLAADSTVPKGEIPGLMMAMDHGAVEASFATGRNSDFLLTPDFRILIGGPGAAEVKVRLGQNGDTCVDNAGVDAPYVLVTSVFDGSDYRVQSGQRVMFQHGSLREVVDQEKEPCGCPPGVRNGNEFPLAQSEGLAPTIHPPPIPEGTLGQAPQTTETLAYSAADHSPAAPQAAPPPVAVAAAQPEAAATPPPADQPTQAQHATQKKRGFFRSLGHFFKKVFGSD